MHPRMFVYDVSNKIVTTDYVTGHYLKNFDIAA